MDASLLARYERNLPRYTSYPTSPHFGAGVGTSDYARWLERLPDGLPVSLYLHIPFCDKLCWFCGCHTRIVRRHEPIEDYLALLEAEIGLLATALGAARDLCRLHLGGGSPSLLLPADIDRLLAAIGRHFGRDALEELAVELDPRDLDEARLRAWTENGLTRASLGVQDLDPVVQRAVNRVQSFDCIARAVDGLRAGGVRGVNFDLIYGLPHQTVRGIEATVDQILALGPDRVALFGYAHVPWLKKHQRLIPDDALPGGPARLAQFLAAAERLQAAGYLWIGLDHFALPGDELARAFADRRLRRNFQGYSSDPSPALLGVGASAIGMLPEGYVQNLVELRPYAEAIRAGRLATLRGHRLTGEDRRRRAIIEALMCHGEVELERFAGRQPAAELYRRELGELARMAEDGLVELAGSTVRITERGRPLMRSAAAVFDSYLAAGPARHSRAV
jgi:oxygen-independent coproporphyrinogen-3 oxidase